MRRELNTRTDMIDFLRACDLLPCANAASLLRNRQNHTQVTVIFSQRFRLCRSCDTTVINSFEIAWSNLFARSNLKPSYHFSILSAPVVLEDAALY